MNFDLTDDQQDIKRTAREFLGARYKLEEVRRLALEEERGVAGDPILRDKVARLKISIEGLRLGAMRALTATMKVGTPGPEGSIAKLQAHGAPGPEGSLGKWHWAEVNQSLSALALDLAGPRAQLVDDPWTYRYLRARANSIEGGTTEILKNIVAERVLGLPRAK